MSLVFQLVCRQLRAAALICMTVCLVVSAAGCGGGAVAEIASDGSTASTLPAIVLADSDWPVWRGTAGDNRSTSEPPVEVTAETMLWKTPISGEGHASPIVVGQQVFLHRAETADKKMYLEAYDLDSGKRTWQKLLHVGGFMHKHGKNSHASATPACDGQRVFTVCMVEQGIWVSAVDLSGNLLWQKKAGPFRSVHGYGASPVLYKSLVIVAGDSPASAFVAALHRETGEIVWRVKRPNGASFGSPVVATVSGKEQLLLSGHMQVHSYDPATGKENWSCDGPAKTTANTIAWNDKLIFASGGYPQQAVMAIRGDGSGQVVWQESLKVYVPSMLVVGERLIVVQDNGVARCFQTSDGKTLWKKRLDGDVSASPTLLGDTVVVPTEKGTLWAFQATSDKYQQVAKSSLDGRCFASPVPAQDRLLLRTDEALMCLGTQ